MKSILKLSIILFLLVPSNMQGLHLVGGEMFYTCLGNNQYEIKLFVYRDCNSSGAPIDPSVVITVFKGSNTNPFLAQNVPFNLNQNIPTNINNPCLSAPPNICTEYAVYTLVATLPPSPDGYTISHQRCCRNGTIDNLVNPTSFGNTYTIEVPPNDSTCNSSPRFVNRPPIVLCLNDPLNLPLTATDPDGDSLFYELCNPLDGASSGNPNPGTSDPPPYSAVPFATGYSATNPITSSPALSLDPNTGVLTGTPNTQGNYTVSICVSEYRNGQYLSTLRRDYQFTVVPCVVLTQANIRPQSQQAINQCQGTTIQFDNTSVFASSYFWDFGVPGVLADTSNLSNPTFTFPDTGVYNVTLVANPDWPCADTTVQTFYVYDPLDADFVYNGDFCLDSNSIQFMPVEAHPMNSTYTWDFGPNANIQTFNGRIPPPITFSTVGPHTVSFKVNHAICEDVRSTQVVLFERPNLDYTLDNTVGCVPFTVNITDLSTTSTPSRIQWRFSSSDFYDTIKSHTYTTPGIYKVTGQLISDSGCVDFQEIEYPLAIIVNPKPTSKFNASPLVTDIYHPEVIFENTSNTPHDSLIILPGDGSRYVNQSPVEHSYIDTGYYLAKVVLINQFGCRDTSQKLIWIQPPTNVFIPNAFTPDGDGMNEVFRPVVTGINTYEFIVFNRWGERVFMTTNPYEGWNGRYENTGVQMATGVYTYQLNLLDQNNEAIQRSGVLKLIR